MKKQTWQQWARAVQRDPDSPSKIRKGTLDGLTGTDARALNAIVPCFELYAYTGDRRVLEAVRLLLPQMQEKYRWVARELIPFVLDWSDRERLWPLVVGPELRVVLPS